ncbi:MAG: VOC family protein [Planctomycetota bacterium]|jgi:predicted enzyme related to lactoylglutathione lyase
MPQADNEGRIDYIEIPVRDVPDAKRFYGELFGWTFKDYGPDYATFRDGRMDGGLNGETAVAPGGPLLVIYATDLESMKKKVGAAGGTIVLEIFEFPGGRRFHFADPSGNVLAVWSDR